MTEHNKKEESSAERKWYRRIPLTLLLVAGGLICAALIPLSLLMGQGAETAKQEKATAQAELAPAKEQAIKGRVLASDIATACENPTLVLELQKLGSEACQKAQAVQELKPLAPTDAQIYDAVDQWLRAHPPSAGRAPSQAELIQAVKATLDSLGQPPTEDEIRATVVGYIEDNPDDFKGEDGRRGPAATDQQVQASVSAFCGQVPSPCAGPKGETGQGGSQGLPGTQGVGVDDFYFERANGVCTAVIVLRNPADGTTRSVSTPAGDAACPGGTPVPTTDPTTTAPEPTG
jgi:hypothetical protein